MAQVTFTERIRKAGASKVIPITKYMSQIDVGEGDKVVVTIGEPSKDDVHCMNIGRMFSVPHALYFNTNYLTPRDEFADGEQIEDLNDKITDEEKVDIVETLSVRSRFLRFFNEYTLEEIHGTYADYSSFLKTFIIKFDPVYNEKQRMMANDYLKIKKTLEFLDAATYDMQIKGSEIKYVSDLKIDLSKAIDALSQLYLLKDRNEIEQKINELNEKRDLEHNTYRNDYFVCVSFFASSNHNSKSEGLDFKCFVIESPFLELAKQRLQELKGKMSDGRPVHDIDDVIIGRYRTKEKADSVKGYLEIVWQTPKGGIEAKDVAAWVEEQKKFLEVIPPE